MSPPALTTICGIVIPSAWDAAGGAVAVAVATYREEKFFVKNDPTGRTLLPLLQKRVILEGIVRREQEEMTIEVKSIRMDDSPVQAPDARGFGEPQP